MLRSSLAPLRRAVTPSLGRLRSLTCAAYAPSGLASAVQAPRALCATGGAARLCSVAAAVAGPSGTAAAAAVAEPVSRAVGWWLIGTAGSVFGMVVLGGVTRLTRSGLSMVDWRPQGRWLPQTEEEWEAEFDKYKQFPEYQRLHKGTGMSLDDFKGIYWYEWAHRMAGRSIGLIFGVPLLGFIAAGKIPRSLGPTLGGLFLLGGSQGLVGWWMVRSGLEQPPADLDGVPRVSPYRCVRSPRLLPAQGRARPNTQPSPPPPAPGSRPT